MKHTHLHTEKHTPLQTDTQTSSAANTEQAFVNSAATMGNADAYLTANKTTFTVSH